jgi:PhoPQ-activated pathogenicity-related protein
VGAVDPNRVKLIAPVVLDAINFVTVEHHQYRSYGGWTYALSDYAEMNITYHFGRLSFSLFLRIPFYSSLTVSLQDDPNMLTLQEMEDPYFYRDRLTMPKLVINAVMDEFQQPGKISPLSLLVLFSVVFLVLLR